MQQIKRVWNNQDLANKVILVTGIIMAIVCLVMGQGMYGVVFILLMLAFVAAHSTQRGKRLRRLYGGMYFHMPDGEIVPMSFEQVSTEYVKGQQGKYADRLVKRAYQQIIPLPFCIRPQLRTGASIRSLLSQNRPATTARIQMKKLMRSSTIWWSR